MITIGFSTRKIDDSFVELLKKTCGVPNPQIIPIENEGKYSLPEAYNMILERATNDIVVLCHDDIYFDSKNWGSKILKHFKRSPEYGVLGLAGSTHLPESAKWWEDFSKMKGIVNHEHGGKKWESKYSASLGNQIDDVVLVDGLFIVLNKKNIKQTFNEEIKGFHFYDVDFSFRNFIEDVKIGVMYDVRVTHKSIGQTNDEWEQNRIVFAEKHKEILPVKIKRNLTINSPIKVLLSSLFFKTFTGSEMYVYELARGLKKLNCDVTVLSDIEGPLSKLANQQGIKTLSFMGPPGYKLGDGKWGFNTPEGFKPSQQNMMYKTSEVNFDIVHVQHNPISQRICDMYPNIPKITTIHSEVIDLENPYIHDSIKKYVCIRPEIQNHIVEKFDIDESNTKVIYNPIDTNRFNTKDTKTYPYILFVGTIDYLRENTIRDLVEYSKSINKELWLVGENKSNYLTELLQNTHVKHFEATNKVEPYVKNCSETAGILLGRTTIEGWLCGKPGWIYNVDNSGEILDKKKHEVPSNMDKFNSLEVAKKIKEEYIKILND
jgi:glycosyltransferase involved in cell wall biosynthesis